MEQSIQTAQGRFSSQDVVWFYGNFLAVLAIIWSYQRCEGSRTIIDHDETQLTGPSTKHLKIISNPKH